MISRKRVVFLFMCYLVVLLVAEATVSWGMDTDLYAVTGLDVPPNVLIILDNSSSMLHEDQGFNYNPDPSMPPPAYDGQYAQDSVYNDDGNGNWILYKNSTGDVICSDARNVLRSDGMYNGKLNSDSSCVTSKKGGINVTLRTGNYLNWQILSSGSNQPRLGLAKGIIHSYINSTDGIRFGIMVFNANAQGGSVTATCSDDKHGAFKALTDIQPSNVVSWTPLAETLYEAMLYFSGKRYYHIGDSYASPIDYRCRKNYVILITDGTPTYDVMDDLNSPLIKKTGDLPFIGDYDGDGQDPGTFLESGSHYLDDVAKFAYEKDLRSDLKGLQNMTTYTIGFNSNQLELNPQLLRSAAVQGGGKYFYCHNASTFDAALQAIIAEILSTSTSFVAPTVPISQLEKTTSENRLYLGMFKPSEKSFWKGNIKKFGIATSVDCKTLDGVKFECIDCIADENGEKSCVDKADSERKRVACSVIIGDIIDANGDLAIDPETNEIYETAASYWPTDPKDGREVEKGGVGKELWNLENPPSSTFNERMIYTYLGNADKSLTVFNATNIIPSRLGVSTEDERNNLISFIYGYDSYDFNQNGIVTEPRDWILGAFIHSRPLVIHYTGRSLLFAGANDGMLHAFDTDSGQELWAFIPPDLLPNLTNLSGNTIQFFVDGSPKAYAGSDGRKILVCGERRGGNHYFALDITDPVTPQWLWEIHPGLSDYSEMGQSWSAPLIGKIRSGGGEKWVMFIGGGYDTNQDNLPVMVTDTKGRAIYVVDVMTGARIWKYSVTENAQMKYSIPSDIARIDINGDGYIDRLYVGDMGGQMWRFDIGGVDPASWTGKRIFNANDPAPSAGTDRKKMFYPPDVSLEKDTYGNYELVLFGTGDREHPKNTAVVDRLYTIKDRNSSTTLTESNLVDVTDDLLQSSSTSPSDKQTVLNNLQSSGGWYIRLSENSGEKCLSPPLVFYGVSYFSTFAPLVDSTSDPCFVGEGTARLYALNYLNGNAVFNFDLSLDKVLGRSDRSSIIGTAIPSGAIIAVIGGNTASGYIGVGGGIFKAPLKSSNVIIPISWKQKF